MRWLLPHADGRARRWLQKLVRAVNSVPIVRKIARKIFFTSGGLVRSDLAPVYALLKAANAVPTISDVHIVDRKYTPSVIQRCTPRLTVVAMARNEHARAHDIMRHFCALFDRVIVIDHLSEDDTARIALSYNGVSHTEVIVLRGLDQGYYQSEYMSACANALIREGATDWIFFLDFDEFLPFQNASSFRQALVDLASCPVIHMHWNNIVLKSLDPPTLQGAGGIIGPNVSEYKKIALNVRAIGSQPVTIAQGNHSVTFQGDKNIYIGAHAFCLLHVPVLSNQALKKKIMQGVRALEKTEGKEATLGFHWRELAGEIEKLEENPKIMREIVLRYSTPLKDVMTDVAAGNYTKSTRHITLKFAQCEHVNTVDNSQTVIEQFTLDTITDVLASRFSPALTENTPDTGGLPAPRYSTLPARVMPGGDMELALLAATTNIKIRAPLVSDGHIPLLFVLLEILKPRRYVELGAHTGVSFFAACQHIHENGNYGEAVAVGEWSDNLNRKGYSDSFEEFKNTLNANYQKIGKFIRGIINANPVFAERSIDMLHIKDVHAYEDVKEIYEYWRPKLADNGVIVLQNTNEYRKNFGIWQFFDSIRSEAQASFQLYHNHGIGILAFGSPENNPAITVLESFGDAPEKVEYYFSYLSKNFM